MEKSFLSSSSLIWLSGLKSALSLDLTEEEESLSYDARGVEILQHSFPSCICVDHIRYLIKTTSREEVRVFLMIQVQDCGLFNILL